MAASMATPIAENVGIAAIDIYFPSQYVSQTELEVADGVSSGKYTIGLGQHALAFVTDREDIYSCALSAVSSFMAKNGIDYKSIGRLEVATETMLDHSKSIKTVLMQLFSESGNVDVEGIDTYNACYGGTAALFNSVAWMESRSWDGRLALVVAADIAEYAAGPARPTGGCGAVVMLVAPNAPLVLEPKFRTSYFEHAYDFFKPNMDSPYPVVDGAYSGMCYVKALDSCYQRLAKRIGESSGGAPFDLGAVDYAVFHAPYNKLVQKAFARLHYNDFVVSPSRADFADNKAIQAFASLATSATLENRAVEQEFVKLSAKLYSEKVGPSTLLPQQLGNMYTASLYAGLLSLVFNKADKLSGTRLLLYSYGSGLASSLFTIRVASSDAAKTQLAKMASLANLTARLADRVKVAPAEFATTMAAREAYHHISGAWEPKSPPSPLPTGAYYLLRKDALGRRFYQQSTTTATAAASTTTTA